MERKVRCIALLAALILAACAAPGPQQSPAEPTATAFADAQRCENEELGFSVEYPDEWWANERIDEGALTPIPSCTYFAPEPVDLRPNAAVPAGIAIRIDLRENEVGTFTEILSRGDTTVDGHDAVVWEVAPPPSAGFIPEGSRFYEYIIRLDGGALLVAATDNILQPNVAYEESKAVLDRMMETIALDD